MQTERPYVLTVAGFDPCSGAGIAADIKTFEQLKVYGLAVCSGLTLQTENEFLSVEWRSFNTVKKEVEVLLNKYPVKAVKFGIVPSFDFLDKMVRCIKKHDKNTEIVVDPVWRSSTGFTLNKDNIMLNRKFLESVTLITPNVPELEFMSGGKEKKQFIEEIVTHSSLLLKGGHSKSKKGIDILHQHNSVTELLPSKKNIYAKHGSGCVLSAAITAYLARGKNLEQACRLSKRYIEEFLTSNKSLLGFHAA